MNKTYDVESFYKELVDHGHIVPVGVSAERFWGGVEIAIPIVATLLTLLLVVMLAARHHPHSSLGRAFNWVIGRYDNLNPPAFPISAPASPAVPSSQVLKHFNFFFNIGQTF